ncbi:cysteine hydrolase family protein [Capnocytophaga cynodegmi]|nr:cysteine hydrolase family protein [Capnocytophaga cynodegmi]
MNFSVKYLLFICVVMMHTFTYGQKRDTNMKTALLIVDIQNDYFEGGAMPLMNPEKASANAKLLLKDFRKKSLPVVHIQHIANRANATFLIAGTKGADIHSDVTPNKGEKVIVKHFPNSFRETELLEYLKSMKIERVVICGMMTHMCIDATTRAAKDFGFDCVVVGDACTTKNLDYNEVKVSASEVHNSFLAALNYFYAKVVSTEQFFKEVE